MKQLTQFTKFIQLWGVIVIIGIIVTVTCIGIINRYHDFKNHSDKIRSDFITSQKQIIKQEVHRVVDLISYEKSQSERVVRDNIKSRGYEAHSIAQHIYAQNKTTKSKAEIQQMILNALRPIRFADGNGYYFAIRQDGLVMLNANRPDLEGKNLLDLQDTQGQTFIKEMIKIGRQSGEGFNEYFWSKPDAEGENYKKISFTKLFQPYDWVIGTGLYVVDIQNQIKNDLLSTISRSRFGEEGYIFVNKLNGDALVSNGNRFSGTQKLWEVFDKHPEKIKDIFDKEYKAAVKPAGDYIYYSWIKLSTPDTESPKISFIYGIPDLQWLVGAGVYLDDVETNIALMQANLSEQVRLDIFYISLIALAIITFFLILLKKFSRRLERDINLILSFFNQAADSDELIDRDKIQFKELDLMAESANKMLFKRSQTEKILEQKSKEWEKTFDAMSDIVTIQDKNMCIVRANKTAHQFFQAKYGELNGKHCYELITGKSKPCSGCPLIATLQDAEPHLAIMTNDKLGIIFQVSSSAITAENGELQYLIHVARDITEQKRIEEELFQAHKMEAVGTLAGGIAHDFNNILSAIIGFSELAKDEIPADSNATKDIDEVIRSSRRATDLVQQILTFSRKSEHHLQSLEPHLIVKEALRMLGSSLPSTVIIHEDIDERCGKIWADPTNIHQIMMNLCINALHAMEAEKGTLTVRLYRREMAAEEIVQESGVSAGAFIVLLVSDTGHGMDEATKERIFDPFFTTKEAGKGSGMGLAVIHGIIQDYKGFVRVDSTPGEGSTFSVYFPALQVEATSPEVSALKESENKAPLPTGNERLLVVDDELLLVRIHKKQLESYGYEVTATTDSNDALEMIRAHPEHFDLLVTDQTMPRLSGAELVKKVLRIKPSLPVIMCTGHSETISEEKALAMGIKRYVYKPIYKNELLETVREVLDEK